MQTASKLMKTTNNQIINNQITKGYSIMEQNNINVVIANALVKGNETNIGATEVLRNVETANYIAVETVCEHITGGQVLNEDAIAHASEDIQRFLNEALECQKLMHAKKWAEAERVFGELYHGWWGKHNADVSNLCSEIVNSLDAGLEHGPDGDDDYDAAFSVQEHIQSGAKLNRNAIANSSKNLKGFLAKATQCQRLLHAHKWVEADAVLGSMELPCGYDNDIPYICTAIYESLWAGVEHGPDAYID